MSVEEGDAPPAGEEEQMEATMEGATPEVTYPAKVVIRPALEDRNRLTTAFRFFLALPHLLLVGGPVVACVSLGWDGDGLGWEGGSGSGLLGAVAAFVAVFSWFVILFTARQPNGLRDFLAYYMRWRVRAISYMTLLRDEYPPFGDGEYPAGLELAPAVEERDRLTVAFRVILAIPHFMALWVLGAAWALTTAAAWVMILVTGRYPESLYGFAIGVLAWGARVETYVLLLHDDYPPFTLRA
jgi:hypothetical protein